MSVQNQTPFNSYNANGQTTVFPFGFLLLDQADMIVSVDGVEKAFGADYTISGLGDPVGGNVEFITAPPASSKVLLKRVLTIQRLTDYQDNGDLLADTLNNDFDRIWQALQQLQQNNLRSLKLPYDTSVDQTLVEDAAARAGLLVGFDAAGNMTLKAAADLSLQVVSAFAATLLDDADAAAARTTLGLNLATMATVSMAGAINEARGTIAMHATTMDLWAQPNTIDGTGSAVTITAIADAPQAGAKRTLYPPAGTIITNNAMFSVEGGANYTTVAGDGLVFEAKSVNTYSVWILRKVWPSGSLIAFSTITASNPAWTPNAATKYFEVEGYGGGGAGGGAYPVIDSGGLGGERGGVNKAVCTSPSGTYAITIGAGGVGVSGVSGQPGSSTTISGNGISLTAVGGNGGHRSTIATTMFSDGQSCVASGGALGYNTSGSAAAANSAAGGGGTFTSTATERTGGNGGSGIAFIWEYA